MPRPLSSREPTSATPPNPLFRRTRRGPTEAAAAFPARMFPELQSQCKQSQMYNTLRVHAPAAPRSRGLWLPAHHEKNVRMDGSKHEENELPCEQSESRRIGTEESGQTDRVLRAFADIVSTRFRASDAVARLGGEEFAAILVDVTGDQVAEVVERIRSAFAASNMVIGDVRVETTVSAGIVLA
jgi:hypothetical protein